MRRGIASVAAFAAVAAIAWLLQSAVAGQADSIRRLGRPAPGRRLARRGAIRILQAFGTRRPGRRWNGRRSTRTGSFSPRRRRRSASGRASLSSTAPTAVRGIRLATTDWCGAKVRRTR